MMCALMTSRETSLDVNSRALHNSTTHAQDCQPAVGKLELPPKAVSFPLIPHTHPHLPALKDLEKCWLGLWDPGLYSVSTLYLSRAPRSDMSAWPSMGWKSLGVPRVSLPGS